MMLLVALAFAQSDEITVYGDLEVARAADDVQRGLEGLGYKLIKRDEKGLTFRPPKNWMGKLVLDPYGHLQFAHPIVAFAGTGGQTAPSLENRELPHADPTFSRDRPMPTAGAGFHMLSKNDHHAVERAVYETVGPQLRAMADARNSVGFRELTEKLPDELDELWSTADSPREAVLQRWADLDDAAFRFRASVSAERWLEEMLVPAPSAEEVKKAQEARQDGRRLPLGPVVTVEALVTEPTSQEVLPLMLASNATVGAELACAALQGRSDAVREGWASGWLVPAIQTIGEDAIDWKKGWSVPNCEVEPRMWLVLGTEGDNLEAAAEGWECTVSSPVVAPREGKLFEGKRERLVIDLDDSVAVIDL